MNATWVLPEETLNCKLRSLILAYSPQEVHTTLLGIFQQDYDFYQTLFAVPEIQPEVRQGRQTPQPQPQVQSPIQTNTKMRADAKIRVVKKATNPIESTIEEAIEIQSVPTPLHVDSLPDVVSAENTAESLTEKQKKAKLKKEQGEAEKKKYAELVSNGITPEDLLTKENLNTWVNTNHLSFTQIARNHLGLPVNHIAEVARGFGIQSDIAKKRAVLAAKN